VGKGLSDKDTFPNPNSLPSGGPGWDLPKGGVGEGTLRRIRKAGDDSDVSPV